MSGRARLIAVVCLMVGAVYLGKGIYRGLTFTRGDFYFTMPGDYARHVNPALWDSVDMQTALGYNHGRYMYGPSQYLTLYPVVFLNSYETIAAVLLSVYPIVLIAAYVVLWRLLAVGEGERPVVACAMFATVFAFLPLTQSLVQREFEVVAFLVLVAACWALVTGREIAAGAALAYLAWFKYWPIVLLGTFVFHRRLKGLIAFAATSAGLLLAAQLVFGLDHFVIGRTIGIVGGLVRPMATGEVLKPVIARGAQKSDFCRQWVGGRGTQAEVRWALCGVEDRLPWLSARAVFMTLVVATGALFAWGAVMLDRRRADTDAQKWGTIWEVSILTLAGASFVHAHYYYYIVFLLPLSALLYWYASRPQPWRRAKAWIWAASYVLLNALIVPTSWLNAIFKRDVWGDYLDSGLCLLGILLLLGLVLWEFVNLATRPPRALVAV